MYEYFCIFPSVLCRVCECIQNTNIFEKLLRSRNLCGTLVVPYLSYLLCLLFAAADVVSFCEWAAQQRQRRRRCLVCVHVCVYVWAKVAKQKRRSGILRALSPALRVYALTALFVLLLLACSPPLALTYAGVGSVNAARKAKVRRKHGNHNNNNTLNKTIAQKL